MYLKSKKKKKCVQRVCILHGPLIVKLPPVFFNMSINAGGKIRKKHSYEYVKLNFFEHSCVFGPILKKISILDTLVNIDRLSVALNTICIIVCMFIVPCQSSRVYAIFLKSLLKSPYCEIELEKITQTFNAKF